MIGNINLYDDAHGCRPDCWVCDKPATYRVICCTWSDDGEGGPPQLSRDWECEFICHRCASVNEANRIGTPHRASNIRYPFTQRQHCEAEDPGRTQYTLLNWPYKVVRPPVKPECKWSREECQEHNWRFVESDDDIPGPST